MKLGVEVDRAAFDSLPLVMAPSTSPRFSGGGPAPKKTDYVIFQNPLIEPPKMGSREVTFKVTLVTGSGSNPISLGGEIQDSGRFNLDEERPSANGAPLRAIGQCLELSSCSVLYVDVFYVENGQHRKQQFLYQGHGSTKVTGQNSGKQSPGAGSGVEAKSGPCDEFEGCEGQFVGHRVEETYYDNLHDWKDRDGNAEPGTQVKGENQPSGPLLLPGADTRTDGVPSSQVGVEVRKEGSEGSPGEVKAPPESEEVGGQGVPVISGEVRQEEAPAAPLGEKPRISGMLQLDAMDLKEGGQSVGLPYTICFEPCASGMCVKRKCTKEDTHRKDGALTEMDHGPNFLELGGGPGFEKLNPRRDHHYGSGLLVRLLEKSALVFREEYDQKSLIQIDDMSKRRGGRLGSHSSHQSGLDADIAYLDAQPRWRSVVTDGVLAEDFDLERNLRFFKLLVDTGYVNRIFVDQKIKEAACVWSKDSGQQRIFNETLMRMRPYRGHDDHFHLRLRCSDYYPLCRDQVPPGDLGC
ncbi:MAG: penicillin-insensitive murein endopeptidase [Bdellovibrionaceae bacterium]|nr:penicillin-insensitive murein endopeptidase [Bdellovibrionales bacterium]MCB9083536.1 penicillin-insensitive murein endopeptidase [Pseudobdellovibrionaceae bacterium]